VTTRHLNESLRLETGLTAGDLIRARRILEAKRLLLHSELTTAEIGYELGFEDPSYFSRFIRRELKNDIVRFDSPATTYAAYLQDLKDDFDVLYAEAGSRRRMMSISTHDRISGIPGRVKLIEEFIKYAQKHKGVVFMRKDEIARWALSAPNVPHEN
jgi:peptidoglycan/xylan/chitin deacetylase (PgdA/CDA1 family)